MFTGAVESPPFLSEKQSWKRTVQNDTIPPARYAEDLFSHGLVISLFGSIEKLQSGFPPNIVRNQKYNAFTFLPIVFYEQFKFFFNLYFLLVALSQFIPALKIGKV
jgi:hypothetical protein